MENVLLIGKYNAKTQIIWESSLHNFATKFHSRGQQIDTVCTTFS